MSPRALFRRAALASALLLAFGACATAADAQTSPEPPAKTLAQRIEPLVKAHKGKVAVAVKNLKTGESYVYHADDVMPTASLIKFPVMIEAYRQAAAGRINLDSTIKLHKADKVPGSGILTDHFSDGATFALRDAVRLMIKFSDNTATNLVLDAIGMGATAETMVKLGCPDTKIHSKVYRRDTSVFPERSKLYGLGSTTAAQMIRLCEELKAGRLVDPKASAAMYEHLATCDDKDKFPRFLPEGAKIAFKTGSVDASRTAAGLIECPAGSVALCVLTTDNEDQRWIADNAGNLICAKIAREVFDHFQNKPETPGPASTVAKEPSKPQTTPGAPPAPGTR
ncbi:serine hydrolase [Paludisphaera borealis]|uniref:Beta-lactamase CARB-6 n=1 Tax=Paludisphaera borealis TaxID=1387353 RepID=A0A1U7CMN5_9BACT|nr:serine hydrolase [Paludisphaera borealis]APW60214.1 Beta-lactamase CARB-6 [Paludisphaera borealis]